MDIDLTLPPLPPLENVLPSPLQFKLRPIHPSFFIAQLQDAPQNPIIDALSLGTQRIVHAKTPRAAEMATRPSKTTSAFVPAKLKPEVPEEVDVWNSKITRETSQILSWDSLRVSNAAPAQLPPFLSQRNAALFASARHFVQPRFHEQNTVIIHVNQLRILDSLRSTLLGNSSTLHNWDDSSQQFVLAGVAPGQKGVLLVDGNDETISSSLLQRFLTIGTHLRRVETLLGNLERSRTSPPITHAFKHSLDTIITFMRTSLSSTLILDQVEAVAREGRSQPPPLPQTRLWIEFSDSNAVLASLAELCLCSSESILNSDPLPLFFSPPALLSHIYNHLQTNTERHSIRPVRALLAYILTHTSRGYLRDLCASVGLRSSSGGLSHNIAHLSKSLGPGGAENALGMDLSFLDDDSGKEDGASDVWKSEFEELPSFLPQALAEALPNARRTLRILADAQPDHPLLHVRARTEHPVQWMWNHVRKVQNDTATLLEPTMPSAAHSETMNERAPGYLPELAKLAIFDSEPGFDASRSIPLTDSSSSPNGPLSDLKTFLDTFPDELSNLTPTLALFIESVFRPLTNHIELLSSALMRLVLLPPRSNSLSQSGPEMPNNLNVLVHLTLLRDYLLLTSHVFKSRLSAALFSDSDSPETSIGNERRYRYSHSGRKASKTKGEDGKDGEVWAVGLAEGLAEGGSWPPGGADLGFYLRRVIVDSLELHTNLNFEEGSHEETAGEDAGARKIRMEAEYRLGFAIQDLHVEGGKAKWLDPLSIEAFEFLYLEYAPPRSLRAVISPEILAKYRRVFAFALRLMRVENVLRMLYRATRESSTTEPVFQSLTPSRRLLVHFCFVANVFVSAFSSYIVDVAIGGNFDSFLDRVARDRDTYREQDDWTRRNPTTERDAPAQAASEPPPSTRVFFRDIFALASHHSAVLDDILSACLLRTGQKAVYKVVQDAFEIILKLGVLVGEMIRGRKKAYDAAPILEELWKNFQARLKTFTGVLTRFVDKGPSAQPTASSTLATHAMPSVREAPGGTAALHHLLLRLDISNQLKPLDYIQTM